MPIVYSNHRPEPIQPYVPDKPWRVEIRPKSKAGIVGAWPGARISAGNVTVRAGERTAPNSPPRKSLIHSPCFLCCTLCTHRSGTAVLSLLFLQSGFSLSPFAHPPLHQLPCPNAGHSEAAVVVVVLASLNTVAVVAVHRRSPRKKTSSTWASTWTRKSRSSSTVVAKVSFLSFLLLTLISNADPRSRRHPQGL